MDLKQSRKRKSTMIDSVPERAVILAAGLGSRLRPFTDDRPKPLVEVRGVPILHNALRNLSAAGVKETTLVVGYRREAIKRCCGDTFEGMRIVYVDSDAFDRTGSAYSLWLASSTLLKGDTLLLEGDVFFDLALLRRVLSMRGDVAAVDLFDHGVTGSAALLATDGGVVEFRMNQSIATAAIEPMFKTVNVYRFTAQTLSEVIVPALERVIEDGERKCYVEQVLARLIESGALKLASALCISARWFEIDNEADLRRAEQIFNFIGSAPSLQEPVALGPSYQFAPAQ
jgi:NDP-sugar pyrophosphorylase family protein